MDESSRQHVTRRLSYRSRIDDAAIPWDWRKMLVIGTVGVAGLCLLILGPLIIIDRCDSITHPLPNDTARSDLDLLFGEVSPQLALQSAAGSFPDDGPESIRYYHFRVAPGLIGAFRDRLAHDWKASPGRDMVEVSANHPWLADLVSPPWWHPSGLRRSFHLVLTESEEHGKRAAAMFTISASEETGDVYLSEIREGDVRSILRSGHVFSTTRSVGPRE